MKKRRAERNTYGDFAVDGLGESEEDFIPRFKLSNFNINNDVEPVVTQPEAAPAPISLDVSFYNEYDEPIHLYWIPGRINRDLSYFLYD